MSRVVVLLVVAAALGACRAWSDASAKFNETKERAYVAVMKTDLRALADSLSAYRTKHGRYVAGTAANAEGKVTATFPADFAFAPGYNVTITVDTSAGGWSATASSGMSSKTCVIAPGSEPVCK